MRYPLRGPINLLTAPELVREGKEQLRASGVSEPQISSEIILESIFDVPLHLLYSERIKVSSSRTKLFRLMIKERSEGLPVQYVTKKAHFFGRTFFVKEGIFIPRPETEILVENVLPLINESYPMKHAVILDICTGSGAIGITVAKEVEKCRVVMTDISRDAILVAEKNSLAHQVDQKVEIQRRNLFPEGGKYDIIISNPPYIKDSEIAFLQDEVKKEPVAALQAGADGLFFIREIISRAPDFMSEGGYLLLEIGAGQAGVVKKFTTGLSFIATKRDLSGIERVIIFKKR